MRLRRKIVNTTFYQVVVVLHYLRLRETSLSANALNIQ